MNNVLVVGIGNILLADEGIGVRVIETMARLSPPPDVELLDGGTSGADLIDYIADRPKVIVIDAVKTEHPPGTILRLGPEDLLGSEEAKISLHDLGLLETLAMAVQMGCPPKQVVIFGVVPASLACSLELSPVIANLVPKIIDLILAEARA